MSLRRLSWVLLAGGLLTAGLPHRAAGQGVEAPGVRARGMAGAFVAVADDASAGWWNPAGLATIRFLDASIDVTLGDRNRGADRPIAGEDVGRWRHGGFFFALPVLGFSVNRLTTTGLDPSATADSAAGRQDRGTLSRGQVLRTTHVGVTLVQSITDAVVVGSTMRVVRGRAGAFELPGETVTSAALARAEELGGRTGTRADVDLGLMAVAGVVRLGVVARNLAAASFEAPDGSRLGFERQVRVGVAVGREPAYVQRAWQVAADADLLIVEGPGGQHRGLAVGAERWWARRRVALRGGGQVQTVGGVRPAASLGGSGAVWSGLLVEAHATAGGDRAARGWGVSARVAF
jgi:hypothetical protein